MNIRRFFLLTVAAIATAGGVASADQIVRFDGKVPVYPNATAVIGAKAPSAADWARGISGSFNTPDSPSAVSAWYLKNGCTVKKMPGDPGTTLTCVGDAAVGIAPGMRGGKHVTHITILP